MFRKKTQLEKKIDLLERLQDLRRGAETAVYIGKEARLNETQWYSHVIAEIQRASRARFK